MTTESANATAAAITRGCTSKRRPVNP
jgi:hypothetical protein